MPPSPPWGATPPPLLVVRVLDRKGQLLEGHGGDGEQVIRPEVAYIVTNLLPSVITNNRGTGRRARELPGPLAGKTGTPSDYKDAWFVGYSKDIVAGTWVGFDDHRSLGHEQGATAALPLWMAFMATALKSIPRSPSPCRRRWCSPRWTRPRASSPRRTICKPITSPSCQAPCPRWWRCRVGGRTTRICS